MCNARYRGYVKSMIDVSVQIQGETDPISYTKSKN
jgi:hypothetical protein